MGIFPGIILIFLRVKFATAAVIVSGVSKHLHCISVREAVERRSPSLSPPVTPEVEALKGSIKMQFGYLIGITAIINMNFVSQTR